MYRLTDCSHPALHDRITDGRGRGSFSSCPSVRLSTLAMACIIDTFSNSRSLHCSEVDAQRRKERKLNKQNPMSMQENKRAIVEGSIADQVDATLRKPMSNSIYYVPFQSTRIARSSGAQMRKQMKFWLILFLAITPSNASICPR